MLKNLVKITFISLHHLIYGCYKISLLPDQFFLFCRKSFNKKPEYFFDRKNRKISTFLKTNAQYCKNISKYNEILYEDRDWDYGFLLKLISFKLKNMQVSMLTNDIVVNSDRYARQMLICHTLCERLLADDYCSYELEQHDLKWGRSTFNIGELPDENGNFPCLIERKNTKDNPEAKEQERKEYRRILDKCKSIREQDKALLFSLMAKHIESWWD